MTLAEVVGELADAVELRAREGKHFGVVLIPEGLIEFIPQVASPTISHDLRLASLCACIWASSSSSRR